MILKLLNMLILLHIIITKSDITVMLRITRVLKNLPKNNSLLNFNCFKEINHEQVTDTVTNAGAIIGGLCGFGFGTHQYLTKKHVDNGDLIAVPGYALLGGAFGGVGGWIIAASYPISLPALGLMIPVYCIRKYKDNNQSVTTIH